MSPITLPLVSIVTTEHPLLTVTPSLMVNCNQRSRVLTGEEMGDVDGRDIAIGKDNHCPPSIDGTSSTDMGTSISPGGKIMLPTFRCSLDSSPSHSQTNHSQMSRNSSKRSNNSNNYRSDGKCNENLFQKKKTKHKLLTKERKGKNKRIF